MSLHQISFDHTTRDAIYEAKVLRIPDLTAKKEKSIRNYFETGDLDKYLGDKLYIAPELAMFLAPQHEMDHFIDRTKRVWSFILENEGKTYVDAGSSKETRDKKFSNAFSHLTGDNA